MTTERGRMNALATLTALQEAGGFSLPAEVVTAASLAARVAAVALPDVPAYGIERAAGDLLDDLTADRPVDVLGYVERMTVTVTAGAGRDRAQTLLRFAHEQAVSAALNTAADHADRTIVAVLRPAFERTLERTGQLAESLAGQPLDARSLLEAPAKVRSAWLELRTVSERYGHLRHARDLANTAGERLVQDDAAGEFSHLADPHGLSGYTPGKGRQPHVDWPDDPIDRMLWLVGPGRVAKPWLPTVAEQDERWQACYGQAQRVRQVAALSARAYAGQQV